MLSRPDHSVFLSQAGEMSHCVKLVDKNWHWEDRGMDVRVWGLLRLGGGVGGGRTEEWTYVWGACRGLEGVWRVERIKASVLFL